MRTIEQLLAGIGGGVLVGAAIHLVLEWRDVSPLTAWVVAGGALGLGFSVVVRLWPKPQVVADDVASSIPPPNAQSDSESNSGNSFRIELGTIGVLAFVGAGLMAQAATVETPGAESPTWIPDALLWQLPVAVYEGFVGAFLSIALALLVSATVAPLARLIRGSQILHWATAITAPVTLVGATLSYLAALATIEPGGIAVMYVGAGPPLLLLVYWFVILQVKWEHLDAATAQEPDEAA